MTTALDSDLRHLLDATPIAHVATLLADGSPHSVPVWIGTHEGKVVFMTGPNSQKARNLRRDPRIAISLTPPEDPFKPVVLRGRVTTWLHGVEGWAVIDAMAQKYVGTAYSREHERVVGVVEIDHHTLGQ
jgi:PPOX class probable F420-dependent enzyme